jgi:hypothetical protein
MVLLTVHLEWLQHKQSPIVMCIGPCLLATVELQTLLFASSEYVAAAYPGFQISPRSGLCCRPAYPHMACGPVGVGPCGRAADGAIGDDLGSLCS